MSERTWLRMRFLAAGLLAVSAAVAPAGAAFLDQGRSQVEYRTWTLGADSSETTVSQLRVPAMATARIGAAQVVLATAGASSTVDPGEGDGSSLAGPADLTVEGFLRMAQDRILLHAGVSLPTGRNGLDAEELGVARILSHPVLAFRLKEYGRGLDLSAGLALAVPLAPGIAAGIGGGFLAHGAYALVEDGDDYTPGNEISLSAGVDFGGTQDSPAPVRLDAVWRTFARDEVEGQEVFEEGDQLTFEANARTGSGKLAASLTGRIVMQSDNTIFTGEGETVESFRTPAGTLGLVIGAADLPVSSWLRLGIEAELSRFSGSEGSARDGQAYGAGPIATLILGEHAHLTARARLLTGSLEAGDDGAEIDLSGTHIALGIGLGGL
jgi:hypothetical protein